MPAVGRHHPVALAVGCRRPCPRSACSADGRRSSRRRRRRRRRRCRRRRPPASSPAVLGGGDADDRMVEGQAGRRAVGAGIAEVPHRRPGRRPTRSCPTGCRSRTGARRCPASRPALAAADAADPEREQAPAAPASQAARSVARPRRTADGVPCGHGSGIDVRRGFLKACTGGWQGDLGVSCVCTQPSPRTGRRSRSVASRPASQLLMTKE